MKQVRKCPRNTVAAAACFITCGVAASTASAQVMTDIDVPKKPLVVESKGSFMAGGTPTVTPTGIIWTLKMYTEFMVPSPGNKIPVVMIHGSGLTGKSFDTTPDGRMGWYEYFVRQDHPVYVVDRTGVGRSGGTGGRSEEIMWLLFRFGPALGTPYAGTKFPSAYASEFAKQAFGSSGGGSGTADSSILADMAVKLKGAVLLAHSASGTATMDAALIDPVQVRGLIIAESGSACTSYIARSDEVIAKLAKVPLLTVWGDDLDHDPAIVGNDWGAGKRNCDLLVARVNAAGGNAKNLYLPDLGIRHNSHMFMFDTNNLQIAELMRKWIDKNVKWKKKGRDDDDDDHHDDDDDHGHKHH